MQSGINHRPRKHLIRKIYELLTSDLNSRKATQLKRDTTVAEVSVPLINLSVITSLVYAGCKHTLTVRRDDCQLGFLH